LFSHLATAAKKSFGAWWQAMNMAGIKSYKKAVSLAYKDVHKKAYVHPTAVVEGSVIGEGAHIGAHCVVRYSVIGKNVNLHDGAKVEYSVVDDQSWLMHDLVLYHSVTETEVFLIHGPYQFSYFQHTSAAFATIMMDYKPDERPIRIATPNGVVDVGSRFMGALLEEKSKVLGGTMTAPGITIFEGQHIGPDASQIVKAKDLKRESKSSESLSDLEQTA
ncbi:MAG: hypothetical protein OEX00_06555, partial [Gammaproteobacteria bacterium]|nr:hypothetical protein [Gammaproteobacteria bacterium]